MVLQNHWDNILHHIMGIAAAMEVWNQDASSPSSQGGENCPGDNPIGTSCSDEGTEDHGEADHKDPPLRSGHGAAETTERTRRCH